ncbi:MAG: hypothetical protein CL583_08825 [Alteromonadaceae bacterium]|nr:hypothetical protein [Alteromonadaceae bacterium]
MTDLHFLRPAWLLLILLIPLILWLWRQNQGGASGWERLIPHPLLAPLMPASSSAPARRGKGWWPAVLLLVAAVALAGPSWRQAPNPLGKQADSLVVALDLSLSMLATDVSPDRLTRAKQKIRDLLPTRADAFTGLVAYAGDAHVVTPLTDDADAIENLLPALDPFMMPAMGSRPDRAVATAVELLQQGGRGTGTIMLVTDGIDERHQDDIQSLIQDTGYGLLILAVGTPEGAPIPLPERGFLRDKGELVTPQLDLDSLEALANSVGGEATRVTLSDDDFEQLGLTDDLLRGAGQEAVDRQLNLDVDDGYWLLWLILPLGLIAWRRGGLAVFALAVTLPVSETAHAFEWQDLWSRPDQQGALLLPENPEAAAAVFEDPAWRGTALYRAGDYERAAEQFSRVEGIRADYNRGNALARAGDLEGAIEAYDKVLEAEPAHDDAQANKALVEQLLEQQQEQQKQQQNSEQNQEGEQNQDQGDEQGQSGSQQSPGDPGDGESSGEPSQNEGETEGSGQEGNQPEESEAEESPGDASGEQQSADDTTEAPGLLSDPEAQDERSREQWMRRVPDDPAGLLRRKFLYQYQQKNSNSEESEPW